MTIKQRFNRRSFLGAATAVAGGLLLPSTRVAGARKRENTGSYPATNNFWYRMPPAIPYIDNQRGNKSFGFSENTIFLSEDNSHTWPHRASFPDARNITFSHIFENGNILFGTRTGLYLSTDNLGSYNEITMKYPDGSDYLPHTPRDPNLPGWYFMTLDGVNSWKIDGKEMLVWGNYCNVVGGHSPINIYYSNDNGLTVKIAYSFGQNPYRKYADASGNLLGDPENPVFCRHVHSVSYNPVENAFYACTGDGDYPTGYECHWLRGTYDAANDSWDWNVIVSDRLNSRYKSGGINFVDGKVYWISDANGPEPHDRGLFRCDPADIPNPDRHTMLFNPRYECGIMTIQDNMILAGQIAVASPFNLGIIFSPDLGKTWVEDDLKDYGLRTPVRINKMNDEGWFRFDLRTGWIDRAEAMFLKPR